MKTSEFLHFAFRARNPLAQVRAGFAELTKNIDPAEDVPLLLFETHIQW